MTVTYKDAGVDLDVYEESMSRLPRLMHRTFSPRVRKLDGGFAGLFQLDFTSKLFARNYREPVLVSGTDGVGTKLKVAQFAGRHRTVGIDLVAMCVNDVLCCGAEPLFFLDYVAMSKDDPNLLEDIVTGVSDGCVEAESALLGGETAIMPDLYAPGDYDLAGFSVGVVEKHQIIDGSAIVPGDIVLGCASTGLHSNGFSLVRKVVFQVAGLRVDDPVPEINQTVGDLLLTPTRIYAKAVRAVLAGFREQNVLHGLAHVTGGGLSENLERIIPDGVQANLNRYCWPIPPVFPWLKRLGNIPDNEMDRVFNMGIGMVFVVSASQADHVRQTLAEAGYPNCVIGAIGAGPKKVVWA